MTQDLSPGELPRELIPEAKRQMVRAVQAGGADVGLDRTERRKVWSSVLGMRQNSFVHELSVQDHEWRADLGCWSGGVEVTPYMPATGLSMGSLAISGEPCSKGLLPCTLEYAVENDTRTTSERLSMRSKLVNYGSVVIEKVHGKVKLYGRRPGVESGWRKTIFTFQRHKQRR